MKPLSENLAILSQRAKRTEDNFAAAKNEARDKLDARREQARADAAATIDKVQTDFRQVKDAASADMSNLKAKIDADLQRMKVRHEQRSHDRDVRWSENRAEDFEYEAALSVDYAIACVEQAELAVLDALAARLEADQVRLEPAPTLAQ